jgi:hypothetical protein
VWVTPWKLDANALRATFDELRAALGDPVTFQSGADALVHDRKAIASSLRQILERLDASRSRGSGPVTGMVHEFHPKHEATRLYGLLESLHQGWRRHVLRVLGERKVELAKKLLDSPAPDLLRILGRDDDENAHSDLIAWLLNPARAPTVAPAALHALVEKFAEPAKWIGNIDRAVAKQLVSVRREVVIAREYADEDDLRRIDVVISGADFVFAIENKVWTKEHTDQTRAYWEWLEPMKCLRGGILLSPSGLEATCPDFKTVSYLELISCLLAGAVENKLEPSEEVVLGSYLKTLARRILPIEMRAVREAAAGSGGP